MTTTFATAMRAVPIVFYGVVSISSLWLAGCAGPGFLNMGAETPAFKTLLSRCKMQAMPSSLARPAKLKYWPRWGPLK